jgi:hypothetical protein
MRIVATFRGLATAASALLIAGVVVATAAPAAADPPELRFESLCGAVAFSWDTGTIGDEDTWATTVLRGTVVIEEFVMRSRGDRDYGATDGDVFEIRRAGLPERTFVHEAPKTCTDAPALTVTAASDCSALQLTFNNGGAAPVTGLQLLAGGDAPRDLAAVEPGEHVQSIDLPDGLPFLIRGPGVTGGWLTWFIGAHAKPSGCAVPSSPSGAPGGNLPVTGVDAASLWTAGVLLAGAGVLLVLVSRRRRAQAR